MAEGRINLAVIREQVFKSGAIGEKAVQLVEKKFEKAKKRMLFNFDDDDVTKELTQDNPESGENISGTLANYNSKEGENGNLFSFLGFYVGDEPTKDLRELLDDGTTMNTTPVFNQKGAYFTFRFTGTVPTKEDVKKVTPLPWGGDRSWVTIVEQGHGGFNYYIYKLYEIATRSTRGVQSKVPVREADFITHKYTTKILNNFVKEVGTSGPQ